MRSKNTLEDLAHEYAGIMWNNEDARESYNTGHDYEAAEDRALTIEATLGEDNFKDLRAFAKGMIPRINAEHRNSYRDSSKALQRALDNMGIHSDPAQALAWAYYHQSAASKKK